MTAKKKTARDELNEYLESTREERRERFARQAALLERMGLGNTQEAAALRHASQRSKEAK